MTSPTKIVYEHLKDYPTSTEGYKDIKAPAVAAAVYGEHMSKPSDKTIEGPVANPRGPNGAPARSR